MKNKSLKKVLAAAMAVCMVTPVAFTMTACSDETDGPGIVTPEATVKAIELDTSAVKKEFKFGEKFTSDGLKVTAVMSDDTKKEVALKDCKISTPSTEAPGRRSVNVTYEGKSARYEIIVKAREIPEVPKTSLLDITEENDSVAYRVEAENIDMAATGVVKPDGVGSFVATAPAESETITSGNKYLTGYGVKYNYFGFTFTAAEEFTNVTIVMRLASGKGNIANLGDSMKAYLNYATVEDEDGEITVTGEIPLSATIDEGVCAWKDVVIRDVTIPQGTNTFTFDAQGENVPDIDYIDFYVGMRYISSVVELSDVTEEPLMVDLEDFDTEFASTREDWANANPDKIVNGLGLEPVTNEAQRENTSRGTSVAALNSGSQLSTTIRLAKDSTVKLYFKGASVSSYVVKERWEFYIDGVKLIMADNTDIQGGDAGKGEFWAWVNVLLGTYNLPAGDHFFLVKNVGGSCNIDGLLFDVVSAGEFDESGFDLDKQVAAHDCENRCPTCNKCLDVLCEETACETKCDCPDVVIGKNGSYKVEAEKINMNGNKYQEGKDTFIEEDATFCSDGKCLAGVSSIGNKIILKFELKGDATVALSAFMAKYEKDFKLLNNAYFTVDDSEQKIYPDTEFGRAEDGSNDWYNWKKVEVGSFELTAGKHTLTIHVEKECPNIDYFQLEVSGLAELTINGNGDFVKEAETLDGSEAVKRPDFGGGFGYNIGGGGIYAFTAGTKFRVQVEAEKDCVVDIFLTLHSDQTKTFGENFRFFIDDVEVTMADPEALMTPNDSWHEEIALRGVRLTAGVHEFRIEVLETHFDFDKITFKTTSYDGVERPADPEQPATEAKSNSEA